MRQLICRSTDPQWHDERNRRVTSSDMSVWLGTAPSFWSDTREDLIARKREGLQKDFDAKTKRRTRHGTEREASIIRMAGLLTGYPTVPFGWLISNDRWPNIAATLDGLMVLTLQAEPDLTLTSSEANAMSCIEDLRYLEREGFGQVILEAKNTDGGHRYKDKKGSPTEGLRAWIDYCPTYHDEQVKTAMAMAEIDAAVLVGSLGADDMAFWVFYQDPAWLNVLDEVNREAAEVLR